MKNTLLFLFLLIQAILFLSAQNSQNPILNSKGLTYDSVMGTIQNENIDFYTKFEVVSDINGTLDTDKLIEIYEILLSQSRNIDNKKYLVKLYLALSRSYLTKNDLKISKDYIDSSFIYEEKIEDIPTKALMNYIASGHYKELGDEKKQHEYLYKTIYFFEQLEGKKSTAILLLYNMAEAYLIHEDLENLENTKNRVSSLLEEIENDVISHIYVLTIKMGYYDLSLKYTKDESYIDSARMVHQKFLEVYNKSDKLNKDITGGLLLQQLLNMTNILMSGQNPNWDEIKKIYDEAINYQILIGEKHAYIGYHDNNIIFNLVKAKILFHEVKSRQALPYALKALKILEQQKQEKNYYQRIDIYRLLSLIYKDLDNYDLALEYSEKQNTQETLLAQNKRYKEIKELAIKYQTAEKELEISRLNEEQQRILYNRTIIIGGFILLTILLIIGILYNRVKRLRKEKEALELAKRIEQKEEEYQDLEQSVELSQMRHYLEGLEAERNRLAKELHDNVASHIYMIDSELNKIDNIPDDIHQQTEALYNQVRSISHELIPPTFRNTSFIEIIANYLFVQEKQSNIKFELNIQEEEVFDRISPKLSLELYRIIQEATSNIIKHASATQAEVNLSYEGEQIILEIIDNGKGFDTSTKYTGIGLHILKDRAQSLNGHLQIDSTPDTGTKITVRVSFLFNQPMTNSHRN